MKRNRTWKKAILISIGVFAILLVSVFYLSQGHINFSLSYRTVDGFENIVFKDSYNKQSFRLCPWGLIKTEDYDPFQSHLHFDRSSDEYQKLSERIDTSDVYQIVRSPNEDYILFVEHKYRGTGVTDDEDVYYRVYSMKDNSITTIFSGYRQFLLVDWKS